MKQTFTTYDIARDFKYAELFQIAKECGYAGVEFRIGNIHKHGVELSMTPGERAAVRRAAEDLYLEVSCVNTPYRYDDKDKLNENIEGSKQAAKLASDLGCGRIRVFGNDIPKGADARAVVAQVAAALAEVAAYAESLGVDVLLEMHGQFNYWGYALPAVEAAGMKNIGILYNCDDRDLVGGSVLETFGRVKSYVRHVHLHNVESKFPYAELFAELVKMDYNGYVSAEISYSSDAKRVLALHAACVRALIALARKT